MISGHVARIPKNGRVVDAKLDGSKSAIQSATTNSIRRNAVLEVWYLLFAQVVVSLDGVLVNAHAGQSKGDCQNGCGTKGKWNSEWYLNQYHTLMSETFPDASEHYLRWNLVDRLIHSL